MPRDRFPELSRLDGRGASGMEPVLRASARHTVRFARTLIGQENDSLRVHNLNFPVETKDETEVVLTRPVQRRTACFFQPNPDDPDSFVFDTDPSLYGYSGEGSDRDIVLSGRISHSVLNFSLLAASKNETPPTP